MCAVCTIAGCAPPVGAYDPKDDKKAAGVVIEKSDRFKHPKGMTTEHSLQNRTCNINRYVFSESI